MSSLTIAARGTDVPSVSAEKLYEDWREWDDPPWSVLSTVVRDRWRRFAETLAARYFISQE